MAKNFWESLIVGSKKKPAKKPRKAKNPSEASMRRVQNPSWNMRVFETKDGKTFAFSKDPTCCSTTEKLKGTGLVPSKSTGRFWYAPSKKK